MKRRIIVCVAAMAIHGNAQAAEMGEKELKKSSAKFKIMKQSEAIPLTILAPDRVSFNVKGKKVGPFDFKGISTQDSAQILAHGKTGTNRIAVGAVRREKLEDQLFAYKFDKKWENPEMLFLKPLKYKKGAEFVKLLDDSILVASVTDRTLFLLNLSYAGQTLDAEMLEATREQHQAGGFAKITGISVKKSMSPDRIMARISFVYGNGTQGSEDLGVGK